MRLLYTSALHIFVCTDLISIDKQFTSLTNKVFGQIRGIWLPFPLPDPNACSGQAKADCPPAPGNSYADSIVIAVPKVEVSGTAANCVESLLFIF